MDADKLNEARSKFMRDNRTLVNNDAPLIAEAFDACADAIMSMPLTDRLTDEEKERIKVLYNEYHAHVFHIEMEQIFGKELFNAK